MINGDRSRRHAFLLCGDSCSGIEGGLHEQIFAAVVAQMAKRAGRRDFVCFLGDHIMGKTKTETPGRDALREQWRRWREHEFASVSATGVDVFHLTSNHNTFNSESEDVFREVFPELPRNGPAHDLGLSYYVVRDGTLLLVFTNSATSRLGPGDVETEWLARILAEHRSIPDKLVFGHYPVLAVNGYGVYPRWRINPSSGGRFWELLVDHGVIAYVCSHVIAFDLRARGGVLQICSGGAGTRYGPNGDFMRGSAQFFHFIDSELENGRLRGIAIDELGAEKAGFEWPLTTSMDGEPTRLADQPFQIARDISALSFDIRLRRKNPCGCCPVRETLVCGYDDDEGPPTLWLGLEGSTLVIELVLEPGGAVGRWTACYDAEGAFTVEIRPWMGPGGVMRVDARGRHSSLETSVAADLRRIRWPRWWQSGQGPSGPLDEPYSGEVEATMTIRPDHRSKAVNG